MTPPSPSCIFSIHSRFQRASFRMSGVPLPDLWNLERNVLELPPVNLPGPQQCAGGDAGVDHVAAIIARIVPAANVVARPTGAGTGVEFAMLVAGGMRVARKLRAQVHRRPAALPVEGAHGQVVGVLEDILAHGEVPSCAPRRGLQGSSSPAAAMRRNPRPAPGRRCSGRSRAGASLP